MVLQRFHFLPPQEQVYIHRLSDGLSGLDGVRILNERGPINASF